MSARSSPFQREFELLEEIVPARIFGRVTRVVGLMAESHGLAAPVGAQCEIIGRGGHCLPAEVVGFREESTILVPCGDIRGVAAGDRIFYREDAPRIEVSPGLIGRVVDASGRALQGGVPVEPVLPRSTVDAPSRRVPVHGLPVRPLDRRRIERTLATGIRSVDGLLSVGSGQRMGIFSGSGVGKSVLLSMIARHTAADVSVIALIGERGREVREFVERDLGAEGLSRTVVVVATSDEPALRRVRAAMVATAIAEYFRDLGLDVMFLLDSLTRVAMSQREIGLSAGEPPATRGYPPSVFAMLPRLLERSGPGVEGSITAFYTVLVEGDDQQDPICDAVRGILDGHLWLSRDLAGRAFYPSIDPLHSVSRSMTDVASAEHLADARHVIALLSKHRAAEDLIQLGAYSEGSDALVDEALRAMPTIDGFLRQDRLEAASWESTLRGLRACARAGREVKRASPAARREPRLRGARQQG